MRSLPDAARGGADRIAELARQRWGARVGAVADTATRTCHLSCQPEALPAICEWLMQELGHGFATLVADELAGNAWRLTYAFYGEPGPAWVQVELRLDPARTSVPSLSGLATGPAVDWHEREIEDLFGLSFEGHPRLGEFILHEDWPEGVNPMRRSFDAAQPLARRERDASWQPPTVVVAPGAFAMPIGPVYSDFAESAHFLLETVGEDVIRTIPRFFYKYRGVEKIAEGRSVDQALLLAERFSGTAAFAHGLAFCQAVEAITAAEVPPRALALRTALAELERLRHHAATIAGICNSTALAVAAAQAAMIEEDLLRLTGETVRHRYLFGAVRPGGMAVDLSPEQCRRLATTVGAVAGRLAELHERLHYSSSFLDRLEEVGIITLDQAISYGLVGPIARASGLSRDMRRLFPYAAYGRIELAPPTEVEGDGYARLRLFFREAAQSAAIIAATLAALPEGELCGETRLAAGKALAAVEAPSGAAFHWLRLAEDGTVARYRLTPPAFSNWHGFHLAAESFAFQDFPIILASFGLSNAECDR